jgi:GTPase SAR1 family protein
MSQLHTTITMVGPSGVGKTSLLASMYEHIKEEVGELGFSFVAKNAGERGRLDESTEELKKFAEAKGVRVSGKLGTSQTTEHHSYEFILHYTDRSKHIPDITIEFMDIPGGTFLGKGNHQATDEALARSQVFMIAVEAWTIMECEGRFHDAINKPKLIGDALERALNKFEEAQPPPLVVFVLVKSEKYLHSGKINELTNQTKVHYKKTIEILTKRKVPMAICAVETVGGVELSAVDVGQDKDGNITYATGNFIRKKSIGYQPKHCEIPLRLVFELALNQAKGERRQGGFFDFLLELFGYQTELSRSIASHDQLKELAEGLSGKLKTKNLEWIHR